MQIAFNDEELMIQDTAKQFGETELKPNAKKVEEASGKDVFWSTKLYKQGK